MAEKTIKVAEYSDGKVIEKKRKMKATALLPRLYRFKFGRDLMVDMAKLNVAYQRVAKSLDENATDEERQAEQFSMFDLTVFENAAWLMMKHAGEDVGESPDEWLENVAGMFTIYEIMPTIVELWNATQITTAKPAKK